MKIIRQNTFETNSSSTHSLSFTSDLNKPPTIKPYGQESWVLVPKEFYEDETWQNKSMILAIVVYCDENSKKIKTISELETLLSDFAGVSISFDLSHLEKKSKDDIFDDAYKFTSPYGFDGLDNFLETIQEILKDKEKIIRFCFTESVYHIEPHSDNY